VRQGCGCGCVFFICPGFTLAVERQPLADAEAVLFIDDDECQRGKVDAVLNQRLGADDELRPPRADVFRCRPARRGFSIVIKQWVISRKLPPDGGGC